MLTIVGLYAAFVVQTAMLPRLRLGAWTPQVVVWAVVMATGTVAPRASIAIAALCGLVADCLSPGTIGPGVIGMGMTAFVALHARRLGTMQSPLVWPCMVGLLAWFAPVASTLARQVLAQEAVFWSHKLSASIFPALSTAACAFVATLPAALLRRASPSTGGHDSQVANHWRMLTE